MTLSARLGRRPLSRRLTTSLRKRLAQATRPSGYRVAAVDGVYFLTSWRNFVDRQIDFFGDYEREQIRFLFDHLTDHPCDVFADIGANLGYYAVQAIQRFPSMRVVAFEPDARNWAQLHANLLINGLIGRVEAHPVAVTAAAGAVPFHAYPDSSTGQSRVAASPGGLTVPGVRLDDALPLGAERLALKIDVEGHELAVLRGMPSLLAHNVALIQVECWPANVAAVEGLLEPIGFRRIRRIADDHFFVRSAAAPTRMA